MNATDITSLRMTAEEVTLLMELIDIAMEETSGQTWLVALNCYESLRDAQIRLSGSENRATGVSFTRGPDFATTKLCIHCWSGEHRSAECGTW